MTTDNNVAVPANSPAAPIERGSPGFWYSQMARDGAPADVLAKFATEHRLVFDATPAQPAPIKVTPSTELEGKVSALLDEKPSATNTKPGSAGWFLQDMRNSGASEADIAQAAKELGIDPADLNKPAGDNVDAYLQSIGSPPAKAGEFALPQIEADSNGELAERHKEFSGWLEAAKFEQAVGNAVAQYAADFERQWSTMSEADRNVHVATVNANLRSVFGASYAESIAAGQALVRETDAKTGGKLSAWLESSGAGNDMRTIVHVCQHAMRLKGRKAAAA